MSFSVDMGMSFSMGVSMSLVVNVVVSTLANDMGLLDDLSDNRLGMSSLNDGLFVDLITNFSGLSVLGVNV